MSQANTTADHDEIRRWAEERGGRPSVVRTARRKGGILRFDFGEDDEKLEETSWEEFFRIFDDSGLAMLHQDQVASGETSRFFRFVSRKTAAEKDGAAKAAPAKRAPAKKAADAKSPAKSPAKPAKAATPKSAATGAGKASSAKAATAKKSAAGKGKSAAGKSATGKSAAAGTAKAPPKRAAKAKETRSEH
jgi:hypothetical protein